jgi:hypothetical protein
VGAPICHKHVCPCGTQVTEKGLHGLKCNIKTTGRLQRHACANDVISRGLRSAAVGNVKEPPGCAVANNKRPDGQTLIPWADGKCAVWDFTTPDTFAPSYLAQTSIYPGAAAARKEVEKRKKYAELEDRYIVVPVAVETTGVWGKEGLQWIRQIGSMIKDMTGEKRAISYLFQSISLALQRGNAAAILGTLPSGRTLEEIYLL